MTAWVPVFPAIWEDDILPPIRREPILLPDLLCPDVVNISGQWMVVNGHMPNLCGICHQPPAPHFFGSHSFRPEGY